MNRLSILGAVALLALGAAGCGRMADLEAPGAHQTERAQRSPSDDPLPEPATINTPSSRNPIDGGPGNPFGGSGSRPD